MTPGDARTDDYLIDLIEPGLETGDLQRLSELDINTLLSELRGLSRASVVLSFLENHHLRSLGLEQTGCPDSRASESDHDTQGHAFRSLLTREVGDTGIEPVTPTVSR